MTISFENDTLHFDRRCVAHYYHGTLPQLLAELHVAGKHEITLDDIEMRGAVMSDTFGVGVVTRPNCYLCAGSLTPGQLCACYDDVLVKRRFNVNSPTVLAALPETTVVEVFCCTSCGDLSSVNAKSALTSHRRNNCYKPRKLCWTCYTKKPRDRRGDTTADSVGLLQQASAAAQPGQA